MTDRLHNTPSRLSRASGRPLRRLLCLLAGLWLASSPAAWAEPGACKTLVASGNPQYPPYLWRDPADEGRLVGANADLMQRLAQELGVTIEMR